MPWIILIETPVWSESSCCVNLQAFLACWTRLPKYVRISIGIVYHLGYILSYQFSHLHSQITPYLIGKILRFIWNINPCWGVIKKTALTAGAYWTSACDLSVGENHGHFYGLQEIRWFTKKTVAVYEDFHKLKTAKFDLFRRRYPAECPAGRQTAREFSKLSGGFFCRFRSKYAGFLRCRGPPRKSETPSHSDFRR